LFIEGDDLYETMLMAIGSAQKTIRLESYLFAADDVGWRFANALSARARASVDVRFHFDSRGAAIFRPSTILWKELIDSGVRLKWYHPWSWRHPTRYFQRNHRKLLVVDEHEAFLGGFNIRLENSRSLYGDDRQRDTHVSVQGELARHGARLFDHLWDHEENLHIDAIPEDASKFDALLVPNSSRRCQHRLACLHAGLISAARRYVYLTSPYFCRGLVIGHAMRAAARRGVDVRLLVPRKGDPPYVGWATRSAYEPLMRAGVKIYEYFPRQLHAKSSVIDGEWSIIGSANLDYLSLFVNLELVLFARDTKLGEALADQYARDLVDAQQVPMAEWSERRRSERWREVVGRSVRRFL